MFERSSDSDGERGVGETGLQKHVDRRTVLRKSAYTTAAAAGLSTVRPVTAADTRELLYGGSPESFGAQDLDQLKGANDTECTEVKLAIGSALVGNETYADDPAKVMCNWCAQINSSAGHTEIDNLEMTVTIDNNDVNNTDWKVHDARKSLREAPQTDGFKPAFSVSVGYFVNFGLSFSASGTESTINWNPESVSYNFGQVCSTDSLAPMENAGWLAVDINDSTTGCEKNCELTVDVSADVTYTGSGPGPCGSNDFLTDTLNAQNSFEVKFDPDDC